MTYEFICEKCKQVVTVKHGIHEDHPVVHSDCGGHLRRKFNSTNIVYHGSGFFTTDKALYAAPEEE